MSVGIDEGLVLVALLVKSGYVYLIESCVVLLRVFVVESGDVA